MLPDGRKSGPLETTRLLPQFLATSTVSFIFHIFLGPWLNIFFRCVVHLRKEPNDLLSDGTIGNRALESLPLTSIQELGI